MRKLIRWMVQNNISVLIVPLLFTMLMVGAFEVLSYLIHGQWPRW